MLTVDRSMDYCVIYFLLKVLSLYLYNSAMPFCSCVYVLACVCVCVCVVVCVWWWWGGGLGEWVGWGGESVVVGGVGWGELFLTCLSTTCEFLLHGFLFLLILQNIIWRPL